MPWIRLLVGPRVAQQAACDIRDCTQNLRPVGATEDVTALGEEASGSVLAAAGEGGAVFYFKRGVSPREAWVAPIRCP